MRNSFFMVIILLASITYASSSPAWLPLSETTFFDRSPRLSSTNHPDGITIELSIPGFFTSDTRLDQTDFRTVSLPGWQTNSEAGVPFLPQLVKCIAIPKSCSLDDISIELLTSDTLTSSVYLAPVPTLINGKVEYRRDLDTYSKNAWYPEKPCSVERTGFIREQKAAWIRINPVQYNPVSNKILIHKNLKLKIRFNNLSPIKPGPFSEIGATLFLNADKSVKPPSRPMGQGSVTYPTDLLNASVTADYILITTDGLIHEPVLDSLAQYRASFSGLDLAVVNVNDIYSKFPSADPSRSIRDFLVHAYEHWTSTQSNDGHPLYTLLVGDGHPASANCIPGYASKPADRLYSCVNDDNGDGGVLDNDQVPDLLVGRFSVKNASELGIVYRKMRRHEAALAENQDWLRKICLVNGFKDSVIAHDVRDGYRGTIRAADKQEYYVISDTLNKRVLGTADLRRSFLDAMNEGRGIFDINAHGILDAWSDTGGELLFGSGDLALLNNGGRLPVIMSFSCFTGDFSNASGDCLGEALVNAPDRGALAFIGSGVEEEIAYNIPYNHQFLDVLMETPDLCLGVVFVIPQWQRTSLGLGYSLLGDPALSFVKPVKHGLPDLVIMKKDLMLAPDNSDMAGWVQVTVHNWGDRAVDSVKVNIYSGDPLNGGIPLATAQETHGLPIQPYGGRRVIQFTLFDMQEGASTPYAWVDPENKIKETKEDNNIAFVPARFVLPDLAVNSNDITVYWGIRPEDHPKIMSKIRRSYVVPIEKVVVGFFDGNPDSGGVLLGTDTLFSMVNNPIQHMYQSSLTLDHYAKNNFTVYVQVDPDNKIREADETNNISSSHQTKEEIFPVDYGFSNEILSQAQLSGYRIGDFTNDGLPDILFQAYGPFNPVFCLSRGGFHFVEAMIQIKERCIIMVHSLIDFNNDGFLDCGGYLLGKEGGQRYGYVFLKNEGDGRFVTVPAVDANGLSENFNQNGSLIFLDYDNDGFPDIRYHDSNDPIPTFQWFRNMGNGEFDLSSSVTVTDSSGTAISTDNQLLEYDYDDDGADDILLPQWVSAISGKDFYILALYQNNGDHTYTDKTSVSGIDGISQSGWPRWIDFDYDGDMDILIDNGIAYQNSRGHFNKIDLDLAVGYNSLLDFDNDGLLEFNIEPWDNRTFPSGTYQINASGLLEQNEAQLENIDWFWDWEDFDGNGFLEPMGYKNPGNSNHWIRIRLRGRQSNAFGLGARIKIYNGLHIQTRDITNEYILNFGLAQNTTIDSVVIRWPSHVVDRLYNVPVDRLLTVTEGLGDASIPTEFMFSQNYPNPFNSQTSMRYSIPGDGHSPNQKTDVKIQIFDVLGREVAILQDNPQPPGNYLVNWDGKSKTGIQSATGVYLCRIMAGKYVLTKKMLLLK